MFGGINCDLISEKNVIDIYFMDRQHKFDQRHVVCHRS